MLSNIVNWLYQHGSIVGYNEFQLKITTLFKDTNSTFLNENCSLKVKEALCVPQPVPHVPPVEPSGYFVCEILLADQFVQGKLVIEFVYIGHVLT